MTGIAVEVMFPPPGGRTDDAVITVRGRSDSAGLAAVRVAGVAATSDDGYATWRATVPLEWGVNTLAVETQDASGNTDPDAAQVVVTRSSLLSLANGGSIVVDASQDRAFVLDDAANALLVAELATGITRPVSGAGVGSGPALDRIEDLALDLAENRALVIERASPALLAIDLTTGDRSVISDSQTGSGPMFVDPIAVAYDAVGARALVVDRVTSAVFAVAVSNGDRVVLSGQGNGQGPAFEEATDVAMHPANDRVLVTDESLAALLAVDLATGDRSVLSDSNGSNGNGWETPAMVAVDAAHNRALVTGAGSPDAARRGSLHRRPDDDLGGRLCNRPELGRQRDRVDACRSAGV